MRLHGGAGRGGSVERQCEPLPARAGIMITSFPGATAAKPGVATKPFFGVDAHVVRADGSECVPCPPRPRRCPPLLSAHPPPPPPRRCGPEEAGFLVVDRPWPGMLRGVYGEGGVERFKKTYFSQMSRAGQPVRGTGGGAPPGGGGGGRAPTDRAAPQVYFTGDGAVRDKEGDIQILGRTDGGAAAAAAAGCCGGRWAHPRTPPPQT